MKLSTFLFFYLSTYKVRRYLNNILARLQSANLTILVKIYHFLSGYHVLRVIINLPSYWKCQELFQYEEIV